jgi:predicted nucleic acid-binding protein
LTRYFADSYAYVEALRGSAKYTALLAENEIVTTALNLQEVAFAVHRYGGDVEAATAPIVAHCVDVPHRVAIAAAGFRAQRIDAGANCSTVDAWGYATAVHLGIPFLTGDEGFRGVPRVKFVKA